MKHSLTLHKVGVVGSGQIGPDIALYFSKVLHRSGAAIVVMDVVETALAAGREKLARKVDKGVETGAFRPDEAAAMKAAVRFTSDAKELKGSELVVEAATERLEVKRGIVATLEGLVAPDAILASNSSHMEPEVIFADARRPGRTLVIHWFFPAERNPLVEVVPGAATDAAVTRRALALYEAIGKVPVQVRSRYGYAVDPVFEGLFQAAALIVEEGRASPPQVDAVAQRALGLGVGPFTAMNLTGGNPITQHGLGEMGRKIMPWFRSPAILDEAARSGRPWPAAGKGETIAVPPEVEELVTRRLRGAYFGLCGEVLDSGIVAPADFELAIELGLAMTPPLRLMNRLGVREAAALVREYAAAQPGFPVPRSLVRQAHAGGPWEIPMVLRQDRDRIATLTIRRPQVLNALNRDVLRQLDDHVRAVGADRRIEGVVLTGFGTKAFVSGADIGMLASLKTPEEAEATCLEFQGVLRRIERLGKPVVCAMNGLAFGGGSELALACTARLARQDLDPLVAQPEPKLGIIPGAGGTQRLPRLVGVERAWELLRTGRTVSSKEAAAIGLVRAEVEGDVREEAARLARDLARGKAHAPPLPEAPIAVPDRLPEVQLGTLSRRIDELLRRAVLEGAATTLEEGLRLEARLFGECLRTKDMAIGLENFRKTGLKSAAAFVHA